jgi:hypothetical protein
VLNHALLTTPIGKCRRNSRRPPLRSSGGASGGRSTLSLSYRGAGSATCLQQLVTSTNTLVAPRQLQDRSTQQAFVESAAAAQCQAFLMLTEPSPSRIQLLGYSSPMCLSFFVLLCLCTCSTSSRQRRPYLRTCAGIDAARVGSYLVNSSRTAGPAHRQVPSIG